MKRVIPFFLMISVITFQNCKKDKDSQKMSNINAELISTDNSVGISEYEARNYFLSRHSFKQGGSNASVKVGLFPAEIAPRWDLKKSFTIADHQVFEVPLTFNSKRILTIDRQKPQNEDVSVSFGVFKRKNGSAKIKSAVMTIIADQMYLKGNPDAIKRNSYMNIDKKFKGKVLFHDWDGEFLVGWAYETGKPIAIIRNEAADLPSNDLTSGIQRELYDDCSTFIVTAWCVDCTDWYVNGVYSHSNCGSPYACGQYTYSECNYNGGGDSGGGGGETTNPGDFGTESEIWVAPPPPGKDIPSLAVYFECFTNSPGSQYQITVAVDQPLPGTRTVWTEGDGGSSSKEGFVNTGHSFLILTQIKADGSRVSRSIGFYPRTGTSPVDPTSPGRYYNDEDHVYNISLTTSVNFYTFSSMIDKFKADAFPRYDLNSYNCTSVCIDFSNQIGIYLPATNGVWPLNGQGVNPADLGEDIRSLILQSNQTRSTSNQNAAKNTPGC